ncbi:fibronectin type III domain-containing protein [Catellatospora vulcania]|uniref:fibronectin type III domain-containing protein n=1 Tax=Catellatospora vulcania TaxID=1460450 RepID=UPI0012D46B2E|nr:fibronectin type III domain-containing protein [Catellatospora vulcania]
MAQPHPAQAQRARDLVVQLGQLLADITAGRPTAAVHQHLLDKFDAAVHDYRIDAMEVGRTEFAATWDALRQGLALPASAWEQVVLPTVVGFSNTQKLKIHLELATSYWLAARAAVDAVPDYPAAVAALATAETPATGPTERTALASRPAAQVRPPTADPVPVATPQAVEADRPRTGPDRRVLVAIAVAVLATITVMLVLIIRPAGNDQPVSMNDGLPSPMLSAGMMADESGQPVTLPTAPPTASPLPSPMITNLPTPAPSWTPPAPATTGPGAPPPPPKPVAPSAPTHLVAVAADEHNVWLAWSPPANGGSGGVSYYRILQNGQFIGWTPNTSATVTGLAPGTSYTFVIIASNAAGLQSGPSNQITAMTASPPPPPSPSPAPPSPTQGPPSPVDPPSPTPEETSAEPSPSPSEPETSPSPEASSPDPEPPVEPDNPA